MSGKELIKRLDEIEKRISQIFGILTRIEKKVKALK
jgi:tetrahydromethanopterin S-methyltransferase subunit G